MARDTGHRDGPVSKYCLEKMSATFCNDPCIGLPGVLCHRLQARSLELIRGPVPCVNRPQTGQPDTKTEAEPLHLLTCHL